MEISKSKNDLIDGLFMFINLSNVSVSEIYAFTSMVAESEFKHGIALLMELKIKLLKVKNRLKST